MLVQGTPVGASNPSLYPIEIIRRIKTEGTGAIITGDIGLIEAAVTDTLASIYAQQTAGRSLGLVLVTEVQKIPNQTSAARKIILPAYKIREIHAKGSGAQITMNNETSYYVEESPATIYAQQTVNIQLGFIGVTRTSDSKFFVVSARFIQKIEPKATFASGSTIYFFTEKTVDVNETITAIQAAIP